MVFSFDMSIKARKITREVIVGGISIGGGKPVVVQSMTTTRPRDIGKTIDAIGRLKGAGCELVRVAVPEEADADALKSLAAQSPVPIVADIHFNPDFAFKALEGGVHKLRINPGTFRSQEKLEALARELLQSQTPIRVGVNSGSVTPKYKDLYASDPVEALVQSGLHYVNILEEYGVKDLVVSLKSSDALQTVAAYSKFSRLSDIPLHIGVTEAGTGAVGAARSAVALTLLLSEGVGDTMRISLTGDPVEEVRACYEVLSSLGMPRNKSHVRIISCPTCGRISFDLESLLQSVKDEIYAIGKDVSVALMGCAVNGPGEAREADIGIAGEKGRFLIFKKGEIVGKGLTLDEARAQLISELRTL